jgi:hypothetical protein
MQSVKPVRRRPKKVSIIKTDGLAASGFLLSMLGVFLSALLAAAGGMRNASLGLAILFLGAGLLPWRIALITSVFKNGEEVLAKVVTSDVVPGGYGMPSARVRLQ